MKFIIVDDCKAFRDSVKYMLEKIHNHEVIDMADNGQAFLMMDNMHLADIILMDIEMPGMNGIVAAKKALQKFRHLNFIAITAYKDKVYLHNLISAGFKGCIFKDSFYDEFEDTIKAVFKDKIKFPQDIKTDHSDNIKSEG